MDKSFNSLLDHLQIKFRRKRINMLLKALKNRNTDVLIDIGGYDHDWLQTSFQGKIIVFNLALPEKTKKGFTYIQGDACYMSSFSDKSHDVSFSNSVIEHVGDFERQKKMASEIRRISKNYWIQTPYLYFPIDPHTMFPFSQFLPRKTQYFIAKNWFLSPTHKFRLDHIHEIDNTKMLNIKEFTELFPDALIIKEKLFGLSKLPPPEVVALKTQPSKRG